MSLFEMHSVSHGYWRGPIFGRLAFHPVLEGASMRIEAGECVALVGPTGSGKSTLGRILLGIERPAAGTVLFDGQPLLDERAGMKPQTRRAIQAVFQDPIGATSPRLTAGEVIAEPLRLPQRAVRDRVATLMDDVGLDSTLMDQPAHRLSGGQLQRVCIARALAPQPRLVLLDEAVSSLDVEIQAQILALLRELKARSGLAYLFVTHDLRLLRHMANRCYVMQDGRPVEVGDTHCTGDVPAALARLQASILPRDPTRRDSAEGRSPPAMLPLVRRE